MSPQTLWLPGQQDKQRYEFKQPETTIRHYPQCQQPLNFQVAASPAAPILTRELQAYIT